MTGPLFPENYSKIWIRGRFITMAGVAVRGKLTLAPTVTGGGLVNRSLKLIMSAASFSADTDNDGYVALQVPATNDPDITPVNFTYAVTTPIGQKFSIVVPYDTTPLNSVGDPLHGQPVIELIDMVPVGSSGGVGQLLRGIGIQSMVDNGAGGLLITYTDGATSTVAMPDTVAGPPGPVGPAGPVGPEGPTGPMGGLTKLADLTDVTATGTAVDRVVTSTQVDGAGKVTGFGMRATPGHINVLDRGAKGDGATNDAVALQAALDAAAAAVKFTKPSTVDGTTQLPVAATVYVPDGLYLTNASLMWPQGVNILMGPNACIRATAAMPVLLDTSAASLSQDQSLAGGILDCNELAQTGLYARSFANLRLTDVNVWNPAANGVILGDPAAPQHAYEPLITRLKVWRKKGSAVPVGSRALWVQDATDGEYSFAILMGCDIGVRCDRGGSTFSHYHPWGYQDAGPSVSFDDNGTGNTWIACSADTPTTYGFRLRQSGARIIAPRFYRNDNTPDATGTAIYVDGATASVFVDGWRNHGNTSTNRWALDIDGPGADSVNFFGKQDANVVTSRGQNQAVQISGKVVRTTRRAASGTADVEQWLHDNGAVLAKIGRSGDLTTPAVTATGFAGATAGGRWIGTTAAGPPTTGTWTVGDWVTTQAGDLFTCIVAGTPGKWRNVGTRTQLIKPGTWHSPGTLFGTSNALGNGTLRIVPVLIHKPIVIDQLALEVTAAGEAASTVRLGIYADNDEYPGALLLDAGTIAADSTGVKTITGLSQALDPGLYWFGAVVQGAPTTQPTIRAVTGHSMTVSYGTNAPTSALAFGYSHAAVAGALPTTFATLGSNIVGTAPRVLFHVA